MQPTSKLRRAVVVAATAMLMTATAGCVPLARGADDVARHGDDIVRHGDDAGRAIDKGRSQRELPPVDLGKAKDGLEMACELNKATRDPEQDCP